jgi:predicted MPP superfamily phosphohydrolase
MPFHLPPLSRRRFLAVAAGTVGTAGIVTVRPSPAAEEEKADKSGKADAVDPHRLALVSDVHVPESPDQRHQNHWDMTAQFRKVVAEIAEARPRPAAVVINGDLAYWTGKVGDYRAFCALLEPLRAAGLPIYVTLGNHDNHENFAEALGAMRPEKRPVDGKHVLVVEMPRANLFLLDSLDPFWQKKACAGGQLGEAQLKWFAEALDSRKDKPALVFVHHSLQEKPDKDGRYFGLSDTADFWAAVKDRRHVKAFLYGHTHGWRTEKRDGLHTVNLPATGYHPNKDAFLGWIDARLADKGMTLLTRGIDPSHRAHGKTVELEWREG